MDHHRQWRPSSSADSPSSPANSSDSPPSPTEIALPRSLFQNHSYQFSPDRILEESFARLRISSNNHLPSSNNHLPSYPSFIDSVPHGGAVGRGCPMGPMPEINLDWNDQLAGSVGGMRPQAYCVGSGSRGLENSFSASYPTSDANEYYSNYDSFLSSRLARQQEVGKSFPTVPLPNGHGSPFNLQQKHGRFDSRNNIAYLSDSEINSSLSHWVQPSSSLQPIGNLRGSMLSLAKNKSGSQLLQEMMTGLKAEEIALILSELIEHVSELMLDPFGNYVFQKILEVCTEEQRTQIILTLTKAKFQLVNISFNMHGARALQKLLEHVTCRNQLAIIISALSPAVAELIKDINGHHVVSHCLKQFSEEQNKHLLNEIANHCLEIATDKNGCCLLQQCVDYAGGSIKIRLMCEIVRHVLKLAQDCYGNYVVQHLISLGIASVTEAMLRRLQGVFFHLSCNKYGSNVVEKFLLASEGLYSTPIISELLRHSGFPMLFVDPFGNFVIRTAVMVSKGDTRQALLKLIDRDEAVMRTTMHGRKLLNQLEKAKLRSF
ncbi:hypothetical protein QN277_017836 [Acacia crassicarpa]|uniref:PUM-HD domain-containing protein n=1 Tax=Acacia crassicarpa TaxID=499986 RepID=A0AAE1MNL1_9FABA|nr:hypothetical protein QN277_017836 [Acacia crassicarpa]